MAALAVGVERRHDRHARPQHGAPRHDWHQRFVDVQHVEPLAFEQPADAPPRARIEADAGLGAVDDEADRRGDRMLALVGSRRSGAEHAHAVAKMPQRARLRADVRVDTSGEAEVGLYVERLADPGRLTPAAGDDTRSLRGEELQECFR